MWFLGFAVDTRPDRRPRLRVSKTPCPPAASACRVLRELDNAAAQFLLDGTVYLIQPRPCHPMSTWATSSPLDTKHIIAWVKENNPKAYVNERYDKTQQPKGYRDCKLGCKRRHNQGEGNGGKQSTVDSGTVTPPATAATPPAEPPLPRPLTPGPPVKSVSASITGVMLPASSPPKCRSGARSSWPN